MPTSTADVNPESSPRYDLVLFGATGFTGRIVAEVLARVASPTLTWAIAGRNLDKLHDLKRELVQQNPRCSAVELIVADSADAESLADMAARARVLVNTAGPFSLYGEPVVRACVEGGADYVDISGEPAFIRRLDEEFAAEAARKGLRIVPCCGFEAIVADLGALYTLRQLPRTEPIELRGYVRAKMRLSGGSLNTTVHAMGNIAAATLPPPQCRAGRKVRALRPRLGRDASLGGWVAPMQLIDQDIVLRSAASLDAYGPDFGYAHHFVFPTLRDLLRAASEMMRMALMAQTRRTRARLSRKLLQPGQGPDRAERETSWFNVRFEGRSAGKTVVTEVSGGDPGYGDTAKMLVQAALCLLEDRDSLPKLAGVLTPVQATGDLLIDRLEKEGIHFRCDRA